MIVGHLRWVVLKFYNDFCFFASLCFNKNIPEADVLQNKCSYKFCKIHKKRSMMLPVLFFCEFLIFFPFLPNISGRLLLKFVEYLFLESFFVSLDKSILLHHICFMSKFSEILMCAEKYFLLLQTKLSPIAVVSPSLVFSLLKHFCSFFSDLSNL